MQTEQACSRLFVFKETNRYYLTSNYYYLQQHTQQGDVCTAGKMDKVLFHCRESMTDVLSVFHQLTLLHTRSDSNKGHEAAEPQVDPQQGLVEVAGDGVGVVLVHEGEGHGGDGVKEEGGAHHCQVPALIFCRPGQPDTATQRTE